MTSPVAWLTLAALLCVTMLTRQAPAQGSPPTPAPDNAMVAFDHGSINVERTINNYHIVYGQALSDAQLNAILTRINEGTKGAIAAVEQTAVARDVMRQLDILRSQVSKVTRLQSDMSDELTRLAGLGTSAVKNQNELKKQLGEQAERLTTMQHELETVSLDEATATRKLGELEGRSQTLHRDINAAIARDIEIGNYHVAAFVTGMSGAAIAVTGAIFGVVALAAVGRTDDQCNDRNVCTQHGVDVRRQGMKDATVANVLAGVGIAVAVGGVTILLCTPKPIASNGNVPRAKAQLLQASGSF